ncbi:cupin domain-containing protein [Paenibacillus chartarius]|uniref:Cupin domain-containing protein n=1 Tax=Paenibacillus chartarius TaxID=747481 RepID=A0ABV6DR06_9BACL
MNSGSLSRTIENRLAKDRVTFVTTAEESGGAYEYVKVELAPGGGVGLHYHLAFTEHFEALHGELHLEVDGSILTLHPGESASAAPGVPHRFFNPGSESIMFHVKIAPARSFERMLRIAYGLVKDGKVHEKSGIPRNIFELAVMFKLGETYMKGIPLWLQKGMFGTLYRIATHLGVEERLLQTYCR